MPADGRGVSPNAGGGEGGGIAEQSGRGKGACRVGAFYTTMFDCVIYCTRLSYFSKSIDFLEKQEPACTAETTGG